MKTKKDLISPEEVSPKIKDEYLDKIEGVLIQEDEIIKKEKELTKRISKNYSNKIHARFVLTGSYYFLSDMSKFNEMPPMEIDWINSDAYGMSGTKANKERGIYIHNPDSIKGKNVVIFEDILDTRRTIKKITEEVKKQKPKNISIVSLLDKPERKEVEIDSDIDLYIGFEIPNYFVVGRGLDCKEECRDIPHICVFKE